MKQLSLLVRYSEKAYKCYYNIIWILKFKNIFKVSLEEAIIKNSKFWYSRSLKRQLRVINNYFVVDVSIEEIKKNYKYRKRKRVLKIFSISKEDYKKLRQKSEEMFFELKYGVKNPYQLEKVKEKAKKTKLKRYNDENFRNPVKIKQTKLERHGNENYNNIEKIKETSKNLDYDKISFQTKQTKLERHGDENYNNREKMKKTNLERYGFESYTQTDLFKNKVKETFFNHFGIDHNKRTHIKNIENLNEEFVIQNFIKDSKFLIDEFEEYFNIISRNTSLNYKYQFNITELNKSNTCRMQQHIFDLINVENKIFNDRHLNKELDIYIPDYNLAIEYDGLMFHSEGKKTHPKFDGPDKNYHLEKTELCLKNNIQLFHIFETEDLDLWLSMINSKLGLNNKIFARKCIIKELKSSECKDFLDYNHLQGFCQAKINVGLFYEDELVSIMSFSKPRFNKKYEYELIRFASKRNYTVVGGASKLWKYFVNKYSPKSVITYANRRFSNGEIYKILGFTFLEKTSPNYFYFKTQDRKLYNRIKFQKKNLKNILEVYDESLSEAENMFNNDYRRIFDCGNLKFEWIKE